MKTHARVYLMQAADGSIKLGHSRNPCNRAKQIGVKVSVVHQTDVLEQAERIERLAHRVLALHGKHIRGEWFEASIEDAVTAIEVAIRQAESDELALGGRLSERRDGRPFAPPGMKTPVALKFDTDLLEEIDAFLSSLPFPTPRTAFIEIACREKLEREARKGRK